MNSAFKGIWLFFLLGNLNAQPISHIVFFGDSLTDNGNLYRASFHIFPPSPPYFDGRFTNGPTWAENVGQFYQSKYGIDYAIYAWAGATATFHLPSSKFIAPTTLRAEVNRYLLLSLFQDRSSVLFVIWIGDNDYLFFNGPDSKVIASVTDAIKNLIRFGARRFLILNLTDASLTPYSQSNGNASTLHQMIMLHNQDLAVAITALKKANPQSQIDNFNAYDFYNEYVFHPEHFNQKYHTHLTREVTPCVAESLTYTELFLRRLFGGSKIAVCADPNGRLNWDSIHSTEPFHYILGQLIIEKINSDYGFK